MMHMRITENILRNLVSPVGLMNNGKASRTIPTQSAQMSLSPLMTSPLALTLKKTRTCSLMVSSLTSTNLALPEYDCKINKKLTHHTIGPPNKLKKTKASKLRNISAEEKKRRTMYQGDRSKNKTSEE
ncbi:hypothetical protein VP01_1971g1 [Puccinia sorghi]|uniref:Uncharacterized protein n=1 Tax=Puccinia sorghi TaxID=27349 RepID=A0A0L6VDM2_9BASI|nr:hypothetical protein VP01_1971g1 [Puccinia sorghi]